MCVSKSQYGTIEHNKHRIEYVDCTLIIQSWELDLKNDWYTPCSVTIECAWFEFLRLHLHVNLHPVLLSPILVHHRWWMPIDDFRWNMLNKDWLLCKSFPITISHSNTWLVWGPQNRPFIWLKVLFCQLYQSWKYLKGFCVCFLQQQHL